MKAIQLKRITLALAAAGLVGGGYALGHHSFIAPAQAMSAPAVAAAPPASVAAALPGFGAIAEKYGPAVVNVSTRRAIPAGYETTPFGEREQGDPFFEFFRRFGPPLPRGEAPTQGLGSGFVVSADGYVLTNAHVVAGASEVTVKLTDRREFPAKVVGLDKVTDVAVLKIEADGLPTVKLGDPARTRVGDWVVAIGSPFGFENSVTAGIVSAKSRSLPDEGYVPFIQTDVAVNPGNSGGPLFNLAGEVIGINSQIYTRSGGYQGLSFAIPIDVASKVQSQIVAHGTVTRGRLGVTIQEVNQTLADSFGLEQPHGALVSSVETDGPAHDAGLRPGDIILKFDGREIGGSNELPPAVANLNPGSIARLEIWRHGQTRQLEVVVGEAKAPKAAAMAAAGAEHGTLGLVVRPLTAEEARDAGAKEGLVVENASGPAARAGIRPGDVILSVNGQTIASVEQLRGLATKAGKHVALLVMRGETRIFVPVAVG